MVSTPRYVRIKRHGPVTVVVMDNPATMNAMDQEMGPRLVGALEGLAADRSVRAVVLTGAGGRFSAGGNLARAEEFLAEHPGRGAAPVFAQYTIWVHRLLAVLTRLPQPVVAAVERAASGGGLGWLLACDLVVLAEDARLSTGFLAIGLAPAAGVSWHLPRLVGLPRAAELLMLGRTLEADQALELGMADRLAPPGETLPVALELAGELARGPAQALSATKELLGGAARRGLFPQAEAERRAVLHTADQREFARRLEKFRRRRG